MSLQNKKLDYTPATNELQDVLFDVALVNVKTDSKETLFLDKDLNGIKVQGYKALINTKDKEVLCVVSDNYKVFTNKDALELGKKAFSQLYPEVDIGELIVYKVIAPKRKTFCHIDLIHKKVNFNVWKQETWIPFLRITNSYNRMFALSFEIGFVRKLCSNGVIFDKETVKVKYLHTTVGIPAQIKVDTSKLKILEKEFINNLLNLKRFYVHKKDIFPMFCKALELNFNFDNVNNPFNNQQKRNFINLKETALRLAKDYTDQDGENAFSALNVMTDIISHQNQYQNLINYSLRANGYYRKISKWMHQYTEAAEQRDFNLEKYLGDYTKYNNLN
jgi:hypothetical protein